MPAATRAAMRRGSFAEHCLDAEPHRTEKACHDDADDGLEGETLGLFHAFAPPSQMLEIGTQFSDGFRHFGFFFVNNGVTPARLHPGAARTVAHIHMARCRHGPWRDRPAKDGNGTKA